MLQKTKNILFQILFPTIITIFFVVVMVYAWTPPTASPPSGNVDAPINVSGNAQIKSGPLQVNGFRNIGSTILDGNVGIGTSEPSQILDVAGFVKGDSGFCIGNECKTEWWPDPEEGFKVYHCAARGECSNPERTCDNRLTSDSTCTYCEWELDEWYESVCECDKTASCSVVGYLMSAGGETIEAGQGCNGQYCYAGAVTADKFCQMQGYQSAAGFASICRCDSGYCQWTGSKWNCGTAVCPSWCGPDTITTVNCVK